MECESMLFVKNHIPCEQLVSPTPNERETTESNRSFLWIDRRPAPWTNKLTFTYIHTYFIYLYTVKSSVKKKLIKATLFYKIAEWEIKMVK